MSMTRFAWNPARVDDVDRAETNVTMHAWKFGGSRHVMVREYVGGLGWSDTVRLTVPDGWNAGVPLFLACQVGTEVQPWSGVFRSADPFLLPRREDSFRVVHADNRNVLVGAAL